MKEILTFIQKNKILLTLAAIVILGAFLRFYNLSATSFVADEFLDMNSSYAFAKTGKWQSWDFNKQSVNLENVFAPRDERAWLYKIQVAELLQRFSPTESTARSVSAAWGVLTIILIYWITFKFTNKKTIGLIAAFLFAVSVMGIEFDRKLRMYAMFYPLFLLFSYFFFQFFEGIYNGKNKLIQKINQKYSFNLFYLIPAAIIGYISLQVHQLTANIAFVVLAYCSVLAVISAIKKKEYVNKYSISVLAAIIAIIFGKVFFKSATDGYLAGLIFFDNHYAYIQEILSDYNNYLLAGVLGIFGGIYLYKNLGKKKEALWILISFFTILFAAIFLWRRNVGTQYIFFGQSFFIILISTGIFGIGEWLYEHVRVENRKVFFFWSIMAFIVLLPDYGYFFRENTTYSQTSKSENPNYRKILGYIKKNSQAGEAVITRNFRNYYLAGSNLSVYDFGGERTKDKITVEMLQETMIKHNRGWVMYSNNDESFVTKEARVFMDKMMEKVNAIDVRGNVSVYRWSQ